MRGALTAFNLAAGHRRALLLLVLLVLLTAGCQQPQGWKEFIPEDTSFAVLMPGTPKAETQTRDGITGTIYVSEDRDTRITYMVGYFDYPQGIPDNLLETTTSGYEVGPFNKLEINEIELSGHRGQEIIYKAFGAPIFHTRLYLVDTRVYTMTAIRPADKLQPEQVDQFFASFTLGVK